MMQQLDLLGHDDAPDLDATLSTLMCRWAARMGDDAHPRAAARITAARFGGWGARSLCPKERARVEAYYRAVLRRRVLRMSDEAASRARKRMVAASIIADLREAGWDVRRAAAEARRIVGEEGRYEAVVA